MIFNCEHCGEKIVADYCGDFVGCDHYPVSKLMVQNNRKTDRWFEVNGLLMKSSDFTNVAKISRVKERKLLMESGLIEPKKGKCGYIVPTIGALVS